MLSKDLCSANEITQKKNRSKKKTDIPQHEHTHASPFPNFCMSVIIASANEEEESRGKIGELSSYGWRWRLSVTRDKEVTAHRVAIGRLLYRLQLSLQRRQRTSKQMGGIFPRDFARKAKLISRQFLKNLQTRHQATLLCECLPLSCDFYSFNQQIASSC